MGSNGRHYSTRCLALSSRHSSADGVLFSKLKVKAKGHRDLVAVVGSLASVSAGEWVTAEGQWVQDKEFGLQFRADMLNSTAPCATNKEARQRVAEILETAGLRPGKDDLLVDQSGDRLGDPQRGSWLDTLALAHGLGQHHLALGGHCNRRRHTRKIILRPAPVKLGSPCAGLPGLHPSPPCS